jgi:hypothetical protein
VLFFEKKNQKTFALLGTWPNSTWVADANWQKFFASFFQKRSLSSFVVTEYHTAKALTPRPDTAIRRALSAGTWPC